MTRINKAVKGNHFSKSAIETALYDALGKKLNVSVGTLLGGIVRSELGVAWTLASGDTQRDIAEAQQMLETKRHNVFKLKVGLRLIKDDLRHITAIKKALGENISVRIDVNQGWSETKRCRCCDLLLGLVIFTPVLLRPNFTRLQPLVKSVDSSVEADFGTPSKRLARLIYF
jgi:muconate cycloisomerase